MTTSTLLGSIAGVLAVTQIIPYVISCLRGITKPSIVAACVSLFCATMTVLTMIASGTIVGIILPIIFTGTGIITLVLAVRYGDSRFCKSDLIVGLFALGAIIAWLVSGPEAALVAMFGARLSGNATVVRKLLKEPGTEDVLSWCLSEAAAVFSVTGVLLSSVLGFLVVAGPAIGLFNCSFVLGVLLWQRHAMSAHRAEAQGPQLIAWAHAHHLHLLPNKTQPDFSLTA